jgi:hypothetical protein
VTDNNTIVLDLSGDKFLAMFLEDLPQKVYDRVVKSAFKVPAKRIAKAASANAPKTIGTKQKGRPPAGTLKKELKVRTLPKRKGWVGVIAGTSPKGWGGPAFYGYFQERGWKIGKRPWTWHISDKQSQERLDELVAIGIRQKFKSAKERQSHLKMLRAAEENLAARKNDKRRKIPPKFFLRRAFDAHKNITKQEMRNELILAVEAETEKAAKKMEREARAAA